MTKHKDSDARNVAVKVKLLESDANPEAEGLPIIFGRSHAQNMNREWFSSVAYHGTSEKRKVLGYLPCTLMSFLQLERKANNMDEVKMKLPAKLGPHTHILFTFYHLTCQTKNPPKVNLNFWLSSTLLLLASSFPSG